MDAGVVMSGSDTLSVEAVLLVSEGLERLSFQRSFTVSVRRAFTPS